MAQKIVQGNEVLASKIKFRRNELGLTIEEAASGQEWGQKRGAGMRQENPFAEINAKGSVKH